RLACGLDQGPRLQLRGDHDRLAPPDTQAVIHQEVRPSGDRVVSHEIGPGPRETTVRVADDQLNARPAAPQHRARRRAVAFRTSGVSEGPIGGGPGSITPVLWR